MTESKGKTSSEQEDELTAQQEQQFRTGHTVRTDRTADKAKWAAEQAEKKAEEAAKARSKSEGKK